MDLHAAVDLASKALNTRTLRCRIEPAQLERFGTVPAVLSRQELTPSWPQPRRAASIGTATMSWWTLSPMRTLACFQLADRLAEGGWRNLQFSSGRGEALVLSHLPECHQAVELIELHP